MSTLFFGSTGPCGCESQAHASGTRGTLRTWAIEVVVQTLLQFFQVEIWCSVAEFARIAAIQKNENTACFLMFIKDMA